MQDLAALRADAGYHARLAGLLHNTSKATLLAERFRALFTLKGLGTDQAVDIVCKAFSGEDSALLKHELAYVLGQMRSTRAVSTLVAVLEDMTENCMVRHEVSSKPERNASLLEMVAPASKGGKHSDSLPRGIAFKPAPRRCCMHTDPCIPYLLFAQGQQ
jgi:HEAT repeat protein